MLKFIIAYMALFLMFVITFIIFVDSGNYFNSTYGNRQFIFWIIFVPLGYVYHKYKPMTFGEIILKFTGIRLPTWQTIKYKFMILMGTDSDYLKKPKDKGDR